MSNTIKVIIVDDQKLMRNGLSTLLNWKGYQGCC